MKLSLAALALLQVSHALHFGQRLHKDESQQLKRTAQETTSNGLTENLTIDDADTRRPKKEIPWWKLPNTDNGEMNAISGEQFYPFEQDDSTEDDNTNNVDTQMAVDSDVCPISQCQSSGDLGKYYCGQNARCLRDYCQCNLGWKGADNVPMSRGWTGLEALTVWVNVYNSGCTERCDSLSCSEVPQVKGCFDQHVTHDANDTEGNDGQGSQEGLTTDGLHLGAIKAPGSDADIGV